MIKMELATPQVEAVNYCLHGVGESFIPCPVCQLTVCLPKLNFCAFFFLFFPFQLYLCHPLQLLLVFRALVGGVCEEIAFAAK